MIITTAMGAKFDTEKPARSPVIKVLNDRGFSILDTLRITGNTTLIEQPFADNFSMVEVEHSFGTDEVSEEFLWQ